MQQFKIKDASSHLEDLVESAIEGKEVFIVKEDTKVVQLVPVEPPTRHAQFGSAEGLVKLSDDFDAPLTLDEGGCCD
jgi:antitoxin (DNA-binding transcriptional repressor) of toxin-antitoxin stability system